MRLRTEGFFKVRGVNINHGDLEDFMFGQRTVSDFRCEVVATGGNDELKLFVELRRDAVQPTMRCSAWPRTMKTVFRSHTAHRGAGDRHART